MLWARLIFANPDTAFVSKQKLDLASLCQNATFGKKQLKSSVLRIRNRIRKDPKLLAGSEINVSDPDLNPDSNPDSNPDPKPDPKQICKKEPYNQTKKQVISDNYFFKTFSRNNMIRISIFATQFTSN